MLHRPRLRQGIAAILVLITVGLFTWYLVRHPHYWQQLRTVSPWVIAWVMALNAAMIVVLVLLTDVTVRLCSKRLGIKENFLLTAYSSIANFFGPLQSGPGVRAVYLKTRHQVRLRDYTLASLIALGLFACYSALFLLIGMRPWWQTLGTLCGVAALSYGFIRTWLRRGRKTTSSHFVLRPQLLTALMCYTFLQVLLTVGWYYVELRAVNPHTTVSQAMSYAGAANFSLFVSITPDGIGIREAFLLFSQSIHHVSTADIVNANIIDRTAYVLFLCILFVGTLGLHAKRVLAITKLRRAPSVPEDEQLLR